MARSGLGRSPCARRRRPRSCCRGPRRRSRARSRRANARSRPAHGPRTRNCGRPGRASAEAAATRRPPLGVGQDRRLGGGERKQLRGPLPGRRRRRSGARRISSRALPAEVPRHHLGPDQAVDRVPRLGLDAQEAELDRPRARGRQTNALTPRGVGLEQPAASPGERLRQRRFRRAAKPDRPQEPVGRRTSLGPRISASRPAPTRRWNSICQSRSFACT